MKFRHMKAKERERAYLLLSLPGFETAEAPVKHITDHDRRLQRADHSSGAGEGTQHTHTHTHPTLSSSQKPLFLSLSLARSL